MQFILVISRAFLCHWFLSKTQKYLKKESTKRSSKKQQNNHSNKHNNLNCIKVKAAAAKRKPKQIVGEFKCHSNERLGLGSQ
jgi:hypothetical protein